MIHKKQYPYKSLQTGLFFYLNKFVRLYPVYSLAIITAVFTQPFFSKVQRAVLISLSGNTIGAFNLQAPILQFPTIEDIVAHLTLLHGLFYQYNTTIMGSAWYMGTEWLCILISPFILFFVMKFQQRRIYKEFVFLFTSQILGVFISREGDMLQHIIRNLPLFLAGMLVARVFIEDNDKRGMYIYIGMTMIYLMKLDYTQNWLSCLFILGIFILIVEKKTNLILISMKNLLEVELIKSLSPFSYAIYMMHMIAIPISFAISIYILQLKGFWLCATAALLTIIILILLSIGSHFLEVKVGEIYKGIIKTV